MERQRWRRLCVAPCACVWLSVHLSPSVRQPVCLSLNVVSFAACAAAVAAAVAAWLLSFSCFVCFFSRIVFLFSFVCLLTLPILAIKCVSSLSFLCLALDLRLVY